MPRNTRITTKEVNCVVGQHWVPEVDTVARINDDYCCADCAEQHNGPGKFQVYVDRPQSMGEALILYQWSLDSGEDDYMTSTAWGYCGRFGDFLLTEDMSGFIEYQQYDSEDEAIKWYDRLYSDGWGANEFDAYIYHEWNRGWQASFDGKNLEVPPYCTRHGTKIAPPSRQRALARIRLEMMRTGYYPNVWEESGYEVKLI